MTILAALLLAGSAAGATLSGLRFLRVAQREHYLAGAASRFAWRWWTATAPASALVVVGVAGLVAGGFLLWPAFLAAVVAGAGPPGLGLRGRTSALAWTRRCRTLAGTAVLLSALPAALAAALGGLRPAAVAAAATALGTPLLLDAALTLLSPLEERLGQRYVTQAKGVLARVRPSVVAITGSYGKTSTKGYVAHLLGGAFTVVASPRSYNNRAGLARTVNELLVPGTDVLVAEMGTYGPGEIAALCAWLPPRVAVLTAIGPVHLERFRRLERTLAAKAEIAVGAETVVCNVDDERLAGLANRLAETGQAVLRCSAGSPAGGAVPDVLVSASLIELTLEVRGETIGTVPLSGGARPSAPTNVACAIGAALALGARPDALLNRLGSLPVPENRLTPSRTAGGIVVLDDTFNSNPAGARLALAELARQAMPGRRRVVVTPGMVELGPLQEHENAAFAAEVARLASDLVIVGRTNRRSLLAGASAKPGAFGVVCVKHREEAVAWVRGQLVEGDVVLYENDLPDHYP